MNYEKALEYIHGTYKFGSKLGLDNINYLLDLMDNPHKHLKVIHVAGTNGKGSTSSYINSILIEEGYKTGLFTSPYLEVFTERIKINNMNIPEEDLARVTKYVKDKVEIMLSHGKNHPTEFEIVTAIAFKYFYEMKVDFVVLEVGMGGRLDSTNVINPLISVITPIAMDHTDYLGDTIEKIAYEKAGIIKENSFVVSHPQEREAMEVIKRVCNEKKSRLFLVSTETSIIKEYNEFGIVFDIKVFDEIYKDIKIKLLGEHQINNVAVALTTIAVLKKEYYIDIKRSSIYNGLIKCKWPGRMEILKRNPTILIDGAHNTHGAQALRKTIDKIFPCRRIIGVIGILGDKDYKGILSEIIPLCTMVIGTKPNNPRALSLEKLKHEVDNFSVEFLGYDLIRDALGKAIQVAGDDDIILCCGSLYMIGEIRTLITKG